MRITLENKGTATGSTNNQIRLKLAIQDVQMNKQNFAHASTALFSWHVTNLFIFEVVAHQEFTNLYWGCLKITVKHHPGFRLPIQHNIKTIQRKHLWVCSYQCTCLITVYYWHYSGLVWQIRLISRILVLWLLVSPDHQGPWHLIYITYMSLPSTNWSSTTFEVSVLRDILKQNVSSGKVRCSDYICHVI